ncbi:MAG: PilZ domain-containing protein [SAR324 cluster bacterium]|nr:PilZ domain-containing protein [SAR324 cluster bacterium]
MPVNFSQNFPLTVERPGQNEEQRWAGTLYGSIRGRCLMVGGFSGREFSVGEELLVRTSLESHIVGFWATVTDKLETMETIYLLSYPEHVEYLDWRKSPRINVFIPAEIELSSSAGSGEPYSKFHGVLLNLSGNGCRVSSQDELPETLHCNIKFSLPGSDESFQLSGDIVRKYMPSQQVSSIGVNFGSRPENKPATDHIGHWISSNKAFANGA